MDSVFTTFSRLRILLIAGAAVAYSFAANGEVIGGGVSPSSGFRDDIWIGGEAPELKSLVAPISTSLLDCALRLQPCLKALQIDERLSTPAADAAANVRPDVTGHAVSVSGLIVVMHAEGSGGATSWSVEGERNFDGAGERSWTNPGT